MEAARVAATRGHQVVLFEKGKSLGGHLLEAAVPDFKKDLDRLLEWYQTQLKELGVTVRLATAASDALIARESPDTVVIATGSGPLIPEVPGVKKANVITATDLLLGRKKAGSTAVVIGGGLIGCEIALWLAKESKKVTVVEMLPELMTGSLPVPRMNQQMLLDLLALNKVKIITGARLQEITEEGVIVIAEAFKKAIKADTVVLALGLKSDNTLYQAMAGKYARLYAIGDCQKPRNIMEALWEGYEVGRTL